MLCLTLVSNEETIKQQNNSIIFQLSISSLWKENSIQTNDTVITNKETCDPYIKRILCNIYNVEYSKYEKLILIVSKECIHIIENENLMMFSKYVIYVIDNKSDNVSIQVRNLFTDTYYAYILYQRTKITDMYFIILGNVNFNCIILSTIQTQDADLNIQGYFTFYFKYIFFASAMDELKKFQSKLANINHVTIFLPKNDNITNIYSAMWKSTGRNFEHIGHLDMLNLTHLQYSSLFPNTKFGFNNQLLYVGSQLWSTNLEKYVVNGETMYSGSYYELLNI